MQKNTFAILFEWKPGKGCLFKGAVARQCAMGDYTPGKNCEYGPANRDELNK